MVVRLALAHVQQFLNNPDTEPYMSSDVFRAFTASRNYLLREKNHPLEIFQMPRCTPQRLPRTRWPAPRIWRTFPHEPEIYRRHQQTFTMCVAVIAACAWIVAARRAILAARAAIAATCM